MSFHWLLLAFCCSHQRTAARTIRDQGGAGTIAIAAIVPGFGGAVAVAVLVVAAAIAVPTSFVCLCFHPEKDMNSRKGV